MDEKTCTKCGETKPVSDFRRDKDKKDGRTGRCRECLRIANAKWNAENRDWHRQYRESHRAEHSLYVEKNRERINDTRRARYAADRGVAWRLSYIRRSQRLGTEPHVESFSEADLLAAHGTDCSYCGGPFECIDHVTPISQGGAHTVDNVRPSCFRCNYTKGSLALDEWLTSEI